MDNLPTNPSPYGVPDAPATAGHFSKAKWLIIIVILGAMVLVTLLLNASVKPKSSGTTKDTNQAKTVTTATGLELAKMSMAYWDGYKMPDGGYPDRIICEQGKTCEASPTHAGHDPLAAIALLRLFNATQNQDYKTMADEIIFKAVEECATGPSAHCIHYSLVLALFYDQTRDSKYSGLAGNIKSSMDPLLTDTTAVGEMSWLYAGHLLDYYHITQDENYKAAAIARFDGEKKFFEKMLTEGKANSFTNDYMCQILLTTSDFYRNLATQEYLDFANELISTHKFDQAGSQFPNSIAVARCIEGYLGFYTKTGQQQYLSGAATLMQKTVETFMDNDYGVFDYAKGQKVNGKRLPINFWIIANLARMNDNKFTL